MRGVREVLTASAGRWPERPAVIDDRGAISFAELDRLLVEPDKRSVRVFAHLAICEALLRHHFALENHSHPTGEE